MRVRTLDEERAHRAEIQKIKDRWFDGEISTGDKRRLIAEENHFYYGDHVQSLTTGRTLTVDDGPEQHVPPARQLELVPATSHYTEEEDEREPWWKR